MKPVEIRGNEELSRTLTALQEATGVRIEIEGGETGFGYIMGFDPEDGAKIFTKEHVQFYNSHHTQYAPGGMDVTVPGDAVAVNTPILKKWLADHREEKRRTPYLEELRTRLGEHWLVTSEKDACICWYMGSIGRRKTWAEIWAFGMTPVALAISLKGSATTITLKEFSDLRVFTEGLLGIFETLCADLEGENVSHGPGRLASGARDAVKLLKLPRCLEYRSLEPKLPPDDKVQALYTTAARTFYGIYGRHLGYVIPFDDLREETRQAHRQAARDILETIRVTIQGPVAGDKEQSSG